MQYFETALGAQNMIYAKWLLAFAVVLILAVVLLRLLRSLMGSSINMTERGSARGRVPRLGVTEFFNLDKQGRRLVIVRRDNIEHLVLIGGPNDVLIESNIVRADRSGAPRIEPRDTGTGFGKPESEAQARIEPVPTRQIAPIPASIEAPPHSGVPPEVRPTPLPLGDRQPVVDIPREDLALRLEEVLRKPVQQRTPEPVTPPVPVPMTYPTPIPPPLRTPQFQPPPPRNPTPEPSVRAPETLRTVEPLQPPEPPRPPEPRVFEPFRPLEPPEPRPSENRSQDVMASILKPRMPLSPLASPASTPPATSAAVALPSSEVEPVEPVDSLKAANEETKPIAEPVVPQTSPTPAPAAAQPSAPKNPFDSLEEEMARLLGRGLGDKQ